MLICMEGEDLHTISIDNDVGFIGFDNIYL